MSLNFSINQSTERREEQEELCCFDTCRRRVDFARLPYAAIVKTQHKAHEDERTTTTFLIETDESKENFKCHSDEHEGTDSREELED